MECSCGACKVHESIGVKEEISWLACCVCACAGWRERARVREVIRNMMEIRE